MKRNIIMILIICIALITCTIFFINSNQKKDYTNEMIVKANRGNEIIDKSMEEQKKIDDINDIVIIELGRIRNENLIDDFIANATYRSSENQELNIIQDNKRIKVTYTSGEYGKYLAKHDDEDDINIDTGDGSAESNRKIYGYYTLYENDKFVAEHVAPTFYVGRTSDKEKNEVNIIFDCRAELATPLPVICKYNLDSSNYKQ